MPLEEFSRVVVCVHHYDITSAGDTGVEKLFNEVTSDSQFPVFSSNGDEGELDDFLPGSLVGSLEGRAPDQTILHTYDANIC